MKKLLLLCAGVILFAGCNTIPANSNQTMSDESSLFPQDTEEFCNGPLVACEWKKVKIQVTLSQSRGNHMLSPKEPYTQVNYGESNLDGQIVVYTKEPITVKIGEKIEVIGTVAKIEKLGTGTLAVEHQIYADSWKLVDKSK